MTDEQKLVTIKTFGGGHAVVTSDEIRSALILNKLELFGMCPDCLVQMRVEYAKRGGNAPITPDTIKAAFKTS